MVQRLFALVIWYSRILSLTVLIGIGTYVLTYNALAHKPNTTLPESGCPTNPFPILEPQDQEISEYYVVQECRASDFEAPKL